MRRPEHLPDYSKPPLDEVVLGVQFAPIPNFTSVDTNGVWALFKDDFPTVEEHPRLPPQFETFGGSNPRPKIQFQVGSSPTGSRLWFVTADDNHLIQFQTDRFLTNWRKRENLQPYPHFEEIVESFQANIALLADHLERSFSYELQINQAEVTYVNIIPVADFSDAANWFSIWNHSPLNIEALNTSFNEVVLDGSGKPMARLFHEIQSAFSIDEKHKAFKLSLTFRGKPARQDVASAIEFLRAGREAIVTRFDEMTSEQAHKLWERLE